MKVEINARFAKAKDSFEHKGGLVLITPPLDEDYWLYRVPLKRGQSIVAFPKFGLIGCGFAKEEKDWNTNLPINCDAVKIYEHIRVNKGPGITRQQCIDAIKAIQEVVKAQKEAVSK